YRIAIDRVMALAGNDHAARRSVTFRTVFKGFDRHFRFLPIFRQGSGKPKKTKWPPGLLLRPPSFQRARALEAAVSRPTTRASCAKSSSWLLHSGERRGRQGGFRLARNPPWSLAQPSCLMKRLKI